MWVSIVGASGYTGAILTNFINKHPYAKIRALISSGREGTAISDLYPGLEIDDKTTFSGMLDEYSVSEAIEKSDLIFTALPHCKSADVAAEAIKKGKKVIDLSADFRLNQTSMYEEWYGFTHGYPELLNKAVYGLCELNKEKIINANLIANPGCYPTSIILGLAPLLKNGLIDEKDIIANSLSGVSGAGRGANLGTSFVEVNESVKAYSIGSHRHSPEITQEVSKLAGSEARVTFSPHLIPVNRGILSTIYTNPKNNITLEEVKALYDEFYKDSYFVKIEKNGILPQTKWVYDSNYCRIGFAQDKRTNKLVIVSVIDNLIKGASGQAVQNMNLMFGFPENTGLEANRLIP